MISIFLALILGAGTYLLFTVLFFALLLLREGYTARCLPFSPARPSVPPMRHLSRLLRLPTELSLALIASLALTLFDCAYLGGGMRLIHLLSVLLGAFVAHRLHKSLLGSLTVFLITRLFDLLLYALHVFLFPIRFVCNCLMKLFRKTLLICKAKHDKIRKSRVSAAYLKSVLVRSKTAFLSAGALEMLCEKTDEEKKNG